MKPESTELCLQVLSAVAWADAELTVEEIARAVDLLEPMNYAPRHRIEEIFMLPCMLPSAARLQMLAAEERLRLIQDAHQVAECFKGVTSEELAVLQSLQALLEKELVEIKAVTNETGSQHQ